MSTNLIFLKNYLNERQGTNFTQHSSTEDILNYLGIRKETLLEEVFKFLNIEDRYVKKDYGGRRESETYYLIHTFNQRYLEFDSGRDLCKKAILCNPITLGNYIRKNILVFYRRTFWLVRKTLDFENLNYQLEFPNRKPWVLQNMRECGYDVNWNTSLEEICHLLDVNIEEDCIYKNISKKLNIIYTERSISSGVKESQSVCVRSDHGNVRNFSSRRKSAIFFSVSHTTIDRRIRDRETLYLNGEMYTLEYGE